MKKLDVAKKMNIKETDYYGKVNLHLKKRSKGQHEMIEGKSEKRQKGKQSLESVGRNEGEKHYLGKNEEPVA